MNKSSQREEGMRHQHLSGRALAALFVCGFFLSKAAFASLQPVDARQYFHITVLDDATSRGIPLVKLTTLTNLVYYTDSAGAVAFFEPALMEKDVFFFVESDGYSYPKDGFGYAGVMLRVAAGGAATIRMKREMIAQRLYRITGTGIYQDSVLLGKNAPISAPIVNANVTGQDSTQVTIYKGKLFFIWGDTGHPRYPLGGNFKSTGGLALLPAAGGMDPDIGVELEYFKKDDFVAQMCPMPGQGNPYWLSSLVSVRDETGRERLLAHYGKIKPAMETIGRGIVEYNDEKGFFEEVRAYPLDDVVQPGGHPFRVVINDREYFYFFADGVYRTPARYEAVIDHSFYEAFTFLKIGTRFEGAKSNVERTPSGAPIYSWKRAAAPIGQKQQNELASAGLIQPEDKWFAPLDVETGKEIFFHSGSIYWNDYRRRWVMVFNELFGSSILGEIWYMEADTPLGPWVYAQKIVTHKKYSFYNSVQHPHFAKHGGREIFFEGTYTAMFSGNEVPTPRYEYNQIMYKLDLADKQLILPVPIYRTRRGYGSAQKISPDKESEIAFMAYDRPRKGTIRIYETREKDGSFRLTTQKPSAGEPLFYALPAADDLSTGTARMYEFFNPKKKEYYYTTEEDAPDKNFQKSEKPVCTIWRYPRRFNPYHVE